MASKALKPTYWLGDPFRENLTGGKGLSADSRRSMLRLTQMPF